MVYETRYEKKDGKTIRVNESANTAQIETNQKTAATGDQKHAPAPRKGVSDEQ